MSTQSPHPPTPKGSRNNNRRAPKKNSTPIAQKTTMLSTPPSSPPRNMSPAGGVTDSSNNIQSKKKPPRSGKKPKDANRASPAPNSGHRHTSSNPNVMSPQVNGNAAYAGPTFHASPAPSALPIPSFFSKSVPESDLPPTLETDSDNAETEPEIETTPSRPRARPPPAGDQKDSTPLDFLFKAAIQARQPNPLSSPDVTARMGSPQTEPKHTASNPPGGVFPFEMESSDHPRASQIGPSFAPSYQDRMNALRSSKSPAEAPESDEQRRLKTEQLRHLLLNPRPQKPPSSVSPSQQQPAMYGTSSDKGNVPHYATPLRTHSGPPTNGYNPLNNLLQQYPNNTARPQTHANGIQHGRPTESPIGHEVPTSYYNRGTSSPYGHHFPANGPVSPPGPANGYLSPQPQYMTPPFNRPTNPPSPPKATDTKKMEDDLRRILKISAGPGIQSSFA